MGDPCVKFRIGSAEERLMIFIPHFSTRRSRISSDPVFLYAIRLAAATFAAAGIVMHPLH
jgi:hypothetical protein